MHKVPRRILIGLGILLLLVGLVGLIAYELVSSALEAKYLARTAQKMTWQLESGPSKRIRYPGDGPYDLRLGYSKLPDYLNRLDKAGWKIDTQAKISIQMARLDDLGLPPAELAIRFSAHAPAVSTAIVGSRRLDHLAEMSALAAKGPLPEDLAAEITSRFACLGPDWPGMI